MPFSLLELSMRNAEEYLPDEESEFTRAVCDHEILLSFRDDEHAYAFHDWWNMVGSKAFVKWVEQERQPEYRE